MEQLDEEEGGGETASWGPHGRLFGASWESPGGLWGLPGGLLGASWGLPGSLSGLRARNVRSGPQSRHTLGAVLGASVAVGCGSGQIS